MLTIKIPQNVGFMTWIYLIEKYFGNNFLPSTSKLSVSWNKNHYLLQNRKNILK